MTIRCIVICLADGVIYPLNDWQLVPHVLCDETGGQVSFILPDILFGIFRRICFLRKMTFPVGQTSNLHSYFISKIVM